MHELTCPTTMAAWPFVIAPVDYVWLFGTTLTSKPLFDTYARNGRALPHLLQALPYAGRPQNCVVLHISHMFCYE